MNVNIVAFAIKQKLALKFINSIDILKNYQKSKYIQYLWMKTFQDVDAV